MIRHHLGATNDSLHVLIVGGGIGGLCLAQGLRKSGISVAVYERDRSAHFRRQGYRIHINPEGFRALQDCLPESLFELLVATSGKPATGRFANFDSQMRELNSRPLHRGAPNDAPSHRGIADSRFALSAEVNRLTLREILLAGLEDSIHFGKTLERVEQTGEDEVCARFTDGTSASGRMLVGADGTGSAVRQFLLPDAKVSEVGWAIYGKTPLKPQQEGWVPESLVTGFSRVADLNGATMIFGAYRKREEFAEATARHAPNLHLTETPDYLMWTFRASLESLGLMHEELRSATVGAIHTGISELVQEWHPSLRRIVAEADVPAMFSVRFCASEPVNPWQTTNVTLLGDAIHTMPPFRGVGANTALRDAELLRHTLSRVAAERVHLLEATHCYEAEMLQYGFEAVRNSMEKPFFGDRNGVGSPDRGSGAKG